MQSVLFDVPFGVTWTIGNAPTFNYQPRTNSYIGSDGLAYRNGNICVTSGTGLFLTSDAPYSNADVDKMCARIIAIGHRNVRAGFGETKFLETNPNSVYGTWGAQRYALWEGKTGNEMHPAVIERRNRIFYNFSVPGVTVSMTNNGYSGFLLRKGVRQGTKDGYGMFALFSRARAHYKAYLKLQLEQQNPYLGNQIWALNPDIESWQWANEEGIKDVMFRTDQNQYGGGFQVRISGFNTTTGLLETMGDHVFTTGDRVHIKDVAGTTSLNRNTVGGSCWIVDSVPDNRHLTLLDSTTGLPPDMTGWGTWVGNSGSSANPNIGGMIYCGTGDRGGDPYEITNITNASLGVLTTRYNHGRNPGDLVFVDDVSGMTQLAGTYQVNTTPAANTMTLKAVGTGTPVDTSSFSTWVPRTKASSGLIFDEVLSSRHWIDQLTDLTCANGREWKAEADALIQARFAAHGWTVPAGGTNGGGWPRWDDMNNPAIYSTGQGGDREKFLKMIVELETEYAQEMIDFIRSYNPNVTCVVGDHKYINTIVYTKVNRPNISMGVHIYQGTWDETNFPTLGGNGYKQRGNIWNDNCTTSFVNGSNSFGRNGWYPPVQLGGFNPSFVSGRLSEDGAYGTSRYTYQQQIHQAFIALNNGLQCSQLVGQGQQKQWSTAIDGQAVGIHSHPRMPSLELTHILLAPVYNNRWLKPAPAHVTYITEQEWYDVARNDSGNLLGSVDAAAFHGNYLQRWVSNRVYVNIADTPNHNDGTWPTNPLSNWTDFQTRTAANPITVRTNDDASLCVALHSRGSVWNLKGTDGKLRLCMWESEVPQNSTLGAMSTGVMSETMLNGVLCVRSDGDYELFVDRTSLFCYGFEYSTDATGFSTTDDGEGSNTVFNISSFNKTTCEVQTSVNHSLSPGDLVTIRGANAPSNLNSPKFRVNTVTAADKITLKDWLTGVAIDATGWSGTYTSGGTIRKSNLVTSNGTIGANRRLMNPEAIPVILQTNRDMIVQAMKGDGTGQWISWSSSYNTGNGKLSLTTDPSYPFYRLDPVPTSGMVPIRQPLHNRRYATRRRSMR